MLNNKGVVMKKKSAERGVKLGGCGCPRKAAVKVWNTPTWRTLWKPILRQTGGHRSLDHQGSHCERKKETQGAEQRKRSGKVIWEKTNRKRRPRALLDRKVEIKTEEKRKGTSANSGATNTDRSEVSVEEQSTRAERMGRRKREMKMAWYERGFARVHTYRREEKDQGRPPSPREKGDNCSESGGAWILLSRQNEKPRSNTHARKGVPEKMRNRGRDLNELCRGESGVLLPCAPRSTCRMVGKKRTLL